MAGGRSLCRVVMGLYSQTYSVSWRKRNLSPRMEDGGGMMGESVRKKTVKWIPMT